MRLFEAVKVNVTASQAAAYCGFTPNRSKMICCPFHNDTQTAGSLSLTLCRKSVQLQKTTPMQATMGTFPLSKTLPTGTHWQLLSYTTSESRMTAMYSTKYLGRQA